MKTTALFRDPGAVLRRGILCSLIAALLVSACACGGAGEKKTDNVSESASVTASEAEPSAQPAQTEDAPSAAPAEETGPFYVPSLYTYSIDSGDSVFEETMYRLDWTETSVTVGGGMSIDQTNTLRFDETGRLTGGEYTYEALDDESRTGTYRFSYENGILAGAVCTGELTKYPDNGTVAFTRSCAFNTAGRIVAIDHTQNDIHASNGILVSYNAAGTTERIRCGSSLSAPEFTLTYDDSGRRIACAVAPGGGSAGNNEALTYTYDGSGVLLQATRHRDLGYEQTDTVLRFSYDAAGRLASVREERESNDYLCEITYKEATAAQYRAWQDIVSCHVDYYGFGMPLISNGNSYSYTGDGNTNFFRW